MSKTHSFHIPVMGIGFTIDTPLKVSQYGIDSVMSIGDDILMERIRKMYCEKFKFPYQEISNKIEDFRAKRVTSYLNLINKLAERKIDELKKVTLKKSNEIKEYFNMLPDSSTLKIEFKNLTSKRFNLPAIKSWLKDNLSMGSLDVNIMTKVDRENYKNGDLLAGEFNDAQASLRGFANSDLHSSVILSAGLNPRLYGAIEQYEDFYPTTDGFIKKKIVLKVSDYRSALIQGKFLAKKGLWVSEFRIESGLNCGGHAFATDGFLLGPILAEFRDQKDELGRELNQIFVEALTSKGRPIPPALLEIKISAQGGVGTAEEHQFLLDHYQVDSVGWGTPFLLVPEAVNVDEITLKKLKEAKEDDLYLSNVSPLGVPFNNLRGNTKELEKSEFKEKGRPGSSCPKKFLALNKEFTEKGICTASRRYQELKLKELDSIMLTAEKYESEYEKIVDKSCICVGLGTSALLVNNLDTKIEGEGVSVCPGPNMAYFSKEMSLQEINDHIYGRVNVIERKDRPNMFLKELFIYLNFLQKRLAETSDSVEAKEMNYFTKFAGNLRNGIAYYRGLFKAQKKYFQENRTVVMASLDQGDQELDRITTELKLKAIL